MYGMLASSQGGGIFQLKPTKIILRGLETTLLQPELLDTFQVYPSKSYGG